MVNPLTTTEGTLPTKVVPPNNFAMVVPGVYRSGYPTPQNFSFLASLGIRSILYLCPEDYPEESMAFLEQSGIQLLRHPMEGNKEPFRVIPENKVCEALCTLLDPTNHPILIHCNKGKHRTGCIIGCLRKMQGWSLTPILSEYRLHAGAKARSWDQQFIESFDEAQIETRNGLLTPSFCLPKATPVTHKSTHLRWDPQLRLCDFPRGSHPSPLPCLRPL